MDDEVNWQDFESMLTYLSRPLKVKDCGSYFESDIDLSGKVDNRDLILLKRYFRGWPDPEGYFQPIDETTQAEANYTSEVGLKLRLGTDTVNYAEGQYVTIPVFADYNTGFISGSLVAKWNPEAMELVEIAYNDSFAPDNRTPELNSDLRYPLTLTEYRPNYTLCSEDDPDAVWMDCSGEQVIRFGSDLKGSNYTQTELMFFLVFKLREGAEPGVYNPTKEFDVTKSVHGRQDDGLVLQGGPVGRGEGHHEGHLRYDLLPQENLQPRRDRDLPLPRLQLKPGFSPANHFISFLFFSQQRRCLKTARNR